MTPSGVVIDTLMEAGLQVVPIPPNVVKASRARYSAAPAKSDDGDSYLLAEPEPERHGWSVGCASVRRLAHPEGF